MIKPTIGRVVLVHRPNSCSDQPEPALISYVWDDCMINVGGFDADGNNFALTHISLLQDDDAPPFRASYAEWMPYQKQQAEKTPSV